MPRDEVLLGLPFGGGPFFVTEPIMNKILEMSRLGAEMVNQWRIIPRIMGALWAWITYDAWVWFTAQPDISNAQAAFLTAITGSAVGFCNFYIKSGPGSKGE